MITYVEAVKLQTENAKLTAEKNTLFIERDTILAERNALLAEVNTLLNELKWLKEQLLLHRKQKWGASSEQSAYDLGQLSLLCETELTSKPSDISKPIIEKTSIVKTYTRRTRLVTDKLPPDMPTETVEHTLPEDKQNCPECGDRLISIGKETVREEIKFIPAKAVLIKHIRTSYGCRVCETEAEKPVIIKPSMPEPVIKGSFASPEAIAHLMVQKYVMGSPLYRQESEFLRQGIRLSRQTMSNWMLKASEDWLAPIYHLLYNRLIGQDALMADETSLQVIKEPGRAAQKKGYLWIYRTVKETEYPTVICEYKPGRHAIYPEKFLKRYKGYIQVDGYEGYHGLPDSIIVTGCWSHARRLYDQALKIIPPKDREGTEALRGKHYCDTLFDIEVMLADMSANERSLWRTVFARPVLDEYYQWLQSFNLLGKTLFAKAVNYSLNQWRYLQNYILDGRLEVSNNRTERTAKMYVLDRKNFLFCFTPRGAESSAVIFSIIQTAIENGLDPYKYLTYIFTYAPNWSISDGPAFAERFLPEVVPDHIKALAGQPLRSLPYDPSLKRNIILSSKGETQDVCQKNA